jgi:hypothetical protein
MKPKGASKDRTLFQQKWVLSHVKYIHVALEGDAFLSLSKPGMGHSMESSPHRFELPTDNPRASPEEEGSHLHTRDVESKA